MKNYVSTLKEELDCFNKHKIHFVLIEHPISDIDNRDGTHTITFSMTFNGVFLSASAGNKKEAKQACYKQVFDKQLIG